MKSKRLGLTGLLIAVVTGSFGFFTVSSAWAAPSAPVYVYAKGISSSEIGINWTYVSGAQGYYIYRSTTETGAYEKIGQTTGADATYYVDKDADYNTPGIQPIGASTEYFYKVAAYDGTGQSALSGVQVFTYTNQNGQSIREVLSRGKTLPAQPPGGVTITDNHDGTVKISWNASAEPNVRGYNIYRADSSGGTFVKLNSGLVTATDYTDNVSFFRDYYYTVAAIDDKDQEGIRSAEIWIKPQANPVANVPHVKFQQDAKECAYCHDSHSASGQDLLTKVSEAEVCFVCHDGTGSKNAINQEFNGNYPSKHPVGQNGLSCASCHDAHLDSKAVDLSGNRLYPAILRPVSINGNMVYKGNEQCYKCHGTGSTLKGGDHKASFESSVHNLNMANPPSGTEIKCISCHEPHGAANANLKNYRDENFCLACHSSNQASAAPDIYKKFTAGNDSYTRHDVLGTDRQKSGASLGCINCHNPHNVTAERKVTDPDNPSPSSLWTGSRNDFCLKCHDGTFPTDTQTQPYAPGVGSGTRTLINIKNYSNYHSRFDCVVCHDPHGSINSYSLKTETTSNTGVNKIGLLTYSWIYQNNGQPALGVDARFFCNSCHGPSNGHINSQSFPTNCFRCHRHDGKF
ncbi:putative multiheme cytochrome c [Thermincola ferriacetica]|uniref:Putative multiheme cytochrome c n=1 Tax=Thermincola ferriacetica TaxID=281456 RepID=A0A0L6W609_9FIRM|nr:cytochrome c3 family protein [Thermincola ferriacetica]KNZ71012.1 putative multiheme cytochrome c [Thermincola ferriacetica]